MTVASIYLHCVVGKRIHSLDAVNMELPHRNDRPIEESKNPIHHQQQNDEFRGGAFSFFSFSWGVESSKSPDTARIELKQSNEVIKNRNSILGRVSLQGMPSGLISDTKKRDDGGGLLYTSYSVYFSYEIFVREFLLNVLHPYFSFYIDPYMHSYYTSNPIVVLYITGVPIFVSLLALSTQFSSDIENTEFVLPILMFILHKVAVALKYASLHPDEYEKMRSARHDATVSNYQDQLQMVTGWLGKSL